MTSKHLSITIIFLPFIAQAAEINQTEWINKMTTALPVAFCNSSQYFRRCFSVTAKECEETAASATRVCLSKNSKNIPAILILAGDGSHWGTIIGKCAGETYEIALTTKRFNNAKCNDVSNWQ